MGRLLSPALFSLVGGRVLFLNCQLHDGGLHRSCSPNEMAESGSGRECGGRSDVWTHCEFPLCDRDAPRRSRDAAFGGTAPRRRIFHAGTLERSLVVMTLRRPRPFPTKIAATAVLSYEGCNHCLTEGT